MNQHKFRIGTLAAILALALAPLAHAGDKAVSGQKLDSGLGKLPHYSQWAKHPQLAKLAVAANSVAGESLDSGLGELPHYSLWAGHPRLAAYVVGVPGEKLDSGLGQLPHYSKWADNTGAQRLDVASRR